MQRRSLVLLVFSAFGLLAAIMWFGGRAPYLGLNPADRHPGRTAAQPSHDPARSFLADAIDSAVDEAVIPDVSSATGAAVSPGAARRVLDATAIAEAVAVGGEVRHGTETAPVWVGDATGERVTAQSKAQATVVSDATRFSLLLQEPNTCQW